MPIKILAQPSISYRLETEPTAETVTVGPDANGNFSHKLLGPITIKAVKEVEDGATVNIRFGGSFNTDVLPCGDQSGSFLLKALAQAVTKAYAAGGKLPQEFPQSITLADVFVRRGNTSMELSIMTKRAGSDGPWQKLSDIQLSYAPDLPGNRIGDQQDYLGDIAHKRPITVEELTPSAEQTALPKVETPSTDKGPLIPAAKPQV